MPTVWAQTTKDVTLNWVGPSYSVIADIATQASADLGFKIVPQTAETTQLMAKVVNQPETVDVADFEFWGMQKVYRAGKLQPIDVTKIKLWGRDRADLAGRQKLRRRSPEHPRHPAFRGDLCRSGRCQGLRSRAHRTSTCVPTIYNADTLGIRPDLIGRKIESWSELFNPEFKGKTSILNIPQIGIMDAAMAIEASGDIKYGDKGNMTKEEIDKTIEILMGAEEGRPVPRLLVDLR